MLPEVTQRVRSRDNFGRASLAQPKLLIPSLSFPERVPKAPGGFRRCFTPGPPAGSGLGWISQRGGGNTGWGKGQKGKGGSLATPESRFLAPGQEMKAAWTRCIDAARSALPPPPDRAWRV